MELSAYFADQSQRGHYSGTVFVWREGKALLDAGYGLARREPELLNTPATTFQLASVSKQFTAGAILLLQEHGALSVNDRLSRWLPACPEAWKPITLHHLLTHTSGIGHWQYFPMLRLDQPIARDELLTIFQQRPLGFSPGTGWAYSSPGYVLLAHVVEQVTGEPYASFLRRAIFGPLGMVDSGVGNHAPRPERQALGYAGKKPVSPFELDTLGIGAGDVWSNTHDLARWDAALTTPGALLRAESLRAMFAPHAVVSEAFSEFPGTAYGYGWLVAEVNGQQVYFHPGDNAGFVALNALLPANDALVILLANDEDVDLEKIGREVLREAFGIA